MMKSGVMFSATALLFILSYNHVNAQTIYSGTIDILMCHEIALSMSKFDAEEEIIETDTTSFRQPHPDLLFYLIHRQENDIVRIYDYNSSPESQRNWNVYRPVGDGYFEADEGRYRLHAVFQEREGHELLLMTGMQGDISYPTLNMAWTAIATCREISVPSSEDW